MLPIGYRGRECGRSQPFEDHDLSNRVRQVEGAGTSLPGEGGGGVGKNDSAL